MPMPLPYKNVFFDENSMCHFDELNEKEYLLNVIGQLSSTLGERAHKFCFIIFSGSNNKYIPASANHDFEGKKKILFYISDEFGKTAIELKNYYYRVFKSYLSHQAANNIFPFPLGHINGVNFSDAQILPVSQRQTDFFFCGNLNRNRIDFFKQFTNIKRAPSFILQLIIKSNFIKEKAIEWGNTRTANNFIQFTTAFKRGLPVDEYNKKLLDSKIVFCPAGFNSKETFRHFEALSAGCIVISEKLPDTCLYQNAPIIQIGNWKEGVQIANSLINKPGEMLRLQNDSIKFYNHNYSPKAVAEFIISTL